jgi:hypothetical protein
MEPLNSPASKETIISNSRKNDLSMEELRNILGYENISDQDAIRTLYSIKELSMLIFFSAKNNSSEQQ